MADRVWTPQQQDSITAIGGTVLVSAAAGSGKTAVLVERVLRRITDPKAPVDVTGLLVVTFTKAAAAEMRQRLSAALSAMIAREPDNPLYQRQQLLLPQASISTVHGFCAALLRENAGQSGIPMGFRIAEPAEVKVIGAQALDEVLEESYQRRDGAFMALCRQLNDLRDDAHLREAVLQLYDFTQAHAFPERWLQEQVDAFAAVQPVEKTRWMAPILREIGLVLAGVLPMADRLVELSAHENMEPYRDTLLREQQRLQWIREHYAAAPYDTLRAMFREFVFDRLPGVSAKSATAEEDKQQVKELRDMIKERIKRVGDWLAPDEAAARGELEAMAPLAEALGDLVRRYAAAFTRRKREKKLLDYGDLEHESLRLLLDSTTGEPTPLAREYAGRYTEILVDEYQDTNAAQDALFGAITPQKGALFMVGDVKQSIYGFRQAMPFIFTDRRDTYPAYDRVAPAFPATITLGNNFRSRREVTEGVNFLFRQLMHRQLGGVDYTGREELVCSAAYADAPDRETEWLVIDGVKTKTEGVAAEAAAIGRRIQQMMGTVVIGEGEQARPLRYGDIGILFRKSDRMGAVAEALTQMGIPTACNNQESFFTTAEVMTALSLLRVIDNPLREVELTALMLSPIGGFTADDCARLRLTEEDRRLPLYTALERTSQQEGELAQRCAALLALLRRARHLAVSMPADRLLEVLYRETGLTAIFAARRDGRRRVANLHRLDQLARGYEQGEFRGLSAFVRYIDRLEKQGGDIKVEGSPSPEAVHLMTIHGSKGLEFPVVFVARLGDDFSAQDAKKQLLFHQTAGIGMRLRDDEAGEKFRTLSLAGVQSALRQDARAEELRVLYVALTRAREKLVLVISTPDLPGKLKKLELQLGPSALLPAEAILRAAGPGDLLLMAALRHPAFAAYRRLDTPLLPDAPLFVLRLEKPLEEAAETPEPAADAAHPPPQEALCRELRQRMGYAYPHEALAAVPAKLAASQLSHQSMARQFIAKARPAFLQQEGLTASQRGTALHAFMQFADYTRGATDLPAEIDRLRNGGYLTEKQADCLPPDKLQGFFASSLYARMAASPDCRREFHFTVAVPAEMAAQGVDISLCAGETVVVQGIADCVFWEGDGLVLVDYKTDRVKEQAELAERYRSQLQFYRQALEPIFGLPVKEAVLYSFHLEQTVTVNLG